MCTSTYIKNPSFFNNSVSAHQAKFYIFTKKKAKFYIYLKLVKSIDKINNGLETQYIDALDLNLYI